MFYIQLNNKRYLVIIAKRTHLFPSRTQKLSSLALMILGGRLPGKVRRRQLSFFCIILYYSICYCFCKPQSIFLSLESAQFQTQIYLFVKTHSHRFGFHCGRPTIICLNKESQEDRQMRLGLAHV